MFLRDVREERKAVITITDGWLLYRPNRNLARPLENARPQRMQGSTSIRATAG